MQINNMLSDAIILVEIGQRLSQQRIALGLTQADLAEQAGVSKRTVERVESGASTQLATMIRIMRVLNLLDTLNQSIPETGPRPIDLLKMKGKQRQRATSKKRTAKISEKWSWDDKA